MQVRHRVAVAAAIVCAVVPVTSVAASTVLTAPYSSTYAGNTPHCTYGDLVQGPPPVGTCDVSGGSSATTGAMNASMNLVSPGGGLLPWSASASGNYGVIATYHLAAPVARLDITVALHVDDASVTNSNQLPGVPPAGTDLLASQMGQAGYVYVSAVAREAQCLPNCVTGADDFAVFQWGAGTASASGQDHIFHITLSNCSNSSALDFFCSQPENLPAGDVSIIGSVGVVANQQEGCWGSTSGHVDAVLTSVTVG